MAYGESFKAEYSNGMASQALSAGYAAQSDSGLGVDLSLGYVRSGISLTNSFDARIDYLKSGFYDPRFGIFFVRNNKGSSDAQITAGLEFDFGTGAETSLLVDLGLESRSFESTRKTHGSLDLSLRHSLTDDLSAGAWGQLAPEPGLNRENSLVERAGQIGQVLSQDSKAQFQKYGIYVLLKTAKEVEFDLSFSRERSPFYFWSNRYKIGSRIELDEVIYISPSLVCVTDDLEPKTNWIGSIQVQNFF